MSITDEFYEMLNGVSIAFHTIFLEDFYGFKENFPNYYWIPFLFLRVFPFMALVGFLPEKWKATVKAKIKYCFQWIETHNFFFPLLFSFALGLRLWYAFTIPLIVSENDSMGRLQQIVQWSKDPNLLPGACNWLPMHHWLLGFPSLLGLDVIVGARVMSVLLAMNMLGVMYLLVKKRFDKTVALLSCLLLSFAPFHVKYSVTAMTEVPFCFFILSALWLLHRFIETDRKQLLVFSSVCVNCACLIRFEGWIIAASLPLYLFYYKKDVRSFFQYGAMNAVCILLWGINSFLMTGDFIYGVTVSNTDLEHTYSLLTDKMQHIWQGLSFDFVFPYWWMTLALPGIFYALKERKEIPWLALALFMVATTTWRIFGFKNEAFWRYYATGLFLLLPFLVYGLLRITRNRPVILAVIICAMLLESFVVLQKKQQVLIEQPQIPAGFNESAEWLHKNRTEGCKILYNSRQIDFPYLYMLTGFTDGDVIFPTTYDMREYEQWGSFSDSLFVAQTLLPDVKYIWVEHHSQMDSVFRKADVQQALQKNSVLFDSVFSAGEYSIYSVTR